MSDWSREPERGAGWLVAIMLWLIRHAGWFATGVVLPGITLWFFATSRAARAASREYLTLALGRRATTREVIRHIHVFAHSILDQVLLLTGSEDRFHFDLSGIEHLEAVFATGRGAVLLGAHFGSFAVPRGLSAQCPVPVKMLMYRGNAGALTHVIDRLDPALAQDIIEIGDIQSLLRVHDAAAQGALVGMLADRAPGPARRISVPFFGRTAAFPAGPFILAASLDVPVLTFSAVRTGPYRYAVRFTPFADRIILRRRSRDDDLAAITSRYAAWLENGCRAHPFNWFNFFPFWEQAPHAPTKARPVPASAAGTTRTGRDGQRTTHSPAPG
jgi:predicted LPLAT superfamily acyltransferase